VRVLCSTCTVEAIIRSYILEKSHNETEDAYIIADHKDEAKQRLENGEVQCSKCTLDNIMENFVLASTAE
jgi:uncharacterized protein YheU (UPF0270 family)